MDWLTQQIARHNIPIGGWSARFIDWLTDDFAWFFDAVADSIEYSIEGVTALLFFAPPLALIALITALVYWLHRSAWLAASIALMLLFIINLGFWEETLETLALVVSAALLCMVAGVPIGIAAAHRPWLYTVLRPVLDLMRRCRPSSISSRPWCCSASAWCRGSSRR